MSILKREKRKLFFTQRISCQFIRYIKDLHVFAIAASKISCIPTMCYLQNQH